MSDPRPTEEYFTDIWKLRYDEVPDDLKISYLEQVIHILLTHKTWRKRCDAIKPVWSYLHQTIERNRRNKTRARAEWIPPE